MRLRRSDCTGPGIARKRRGRGFVYVDPDGERVAEDEVLVRINELVIPPGWQDVWICPYPGGHIQATGIDEKGRKQYLYHPKWRERRDAQKFREMENFARALPSMRKRVDADIARDDLSREHVLAIAVRLLDKGFFRIGSEDYAETNESYGLATMRKDHCVIDGDVMYFDYPAKSGKRRVQQVLDADIADAVATLRRRRGGTPELLAWRDGRRWVDVKSPDINAYIKDATHREASAKDFRTWGATVLAAVSLAVLEEPHSPTARKRRISWVVKQVAHHLGNTPAVARASYIDPRVFDRYRDGQTIERALVKLGDDPEATAIQGPIEKAVLDLLQ